MSNGYMVIGAKHFFLEKIPQGEGGFGVHPDQVIKIVKEE